MIKIKIILFGLLLSLLTACSNGRRSENLFFYSSMNKRFACDTIYDPLIQGGKRVINIYQQSDGKQVNYEGRNYYRYKLSTDLDGAWMLLNYRKGKVFIIPEEVLRHSNRFNEEMLLDLNAKIGSEWALGQGGVLGNSIFRLDSITNDTYYISARAEYKIADSNQVIGFTLSKTTGVKSLTLITLGDTIYCECNDSQLQ